MMRTLKLMLMVVVTHGFMQSAFAADDYQVPKTAHGHPDLQGVWSNATLTTLERPKYYADRATLTEQEAQQREQMRAASAEKGALPSDPNAPAPEKGKNVGGYNQFWMDPGTALAKVGDEFRTSLITYPKDGKVPYKPATQQRVAQFIGTIQDDFDGPEQRPLGERCIVGFGSSGGPPMLPVLYNNHYQIVQNEDHVLIHVEMNHDARIVRIGESHGSLRPWLGDSVGTYDGDTLVVTTTNFPAGQNCRAAIKHRFCMTENSVVTERFTRVSDKQIIYEFDVEDPAAFTRAWGGEIPLNAAQGPIYEYACHEGNYALPGILAGARQGEESTSGGQ